MTVEQGPHQSRASSRHVSSHAITWETHLLLKHKSDMKYDASKFIVATVKTPHLTVPRKKPDYT
jgi:hypothetical protein